MAAVSGYPGHSHSAQNGDTSHWNYSIPADRELQNDYPRRSLSGSKQPVQKLNFNPPSKQANGELQSRIRPKTPDRHEGQNLNSETPGQTKLAGSLDPAYLSPPRLGLRPGMNESRSGSEADSLLDLYGRPRSLGERSLGTSFDKGERSGLQEELTFDEDDPEHSRWIHRDKLALIESHEMREAGIKLPPQPKRTSSKSKGRRHHVPDTEVPTLPEQDADSWGSKQAKKQRTRSPVRQEEEKEEAVFNEFDLRRPEEIAADKDVQGSPSQIYQQQDLRKSSSRIPLPRSSPMPIPQEHIERDTPLPRRRGLSGNWADGENGLSYNRSRSRGNSVGSQILLDDPDLSYSTPPRPATSDSPPKVRIPTTKPTHIRSPSNSAQQPKSRATSTNNTPRTPPSSTTQRPKSRSGLEPRPATAVNRPEGDPPWLATMYKPDPRLPPEQQLLPTHAKRLQQEQWEQARKDTEQRRLNGKASPPLPREFSPLAEHTVNGLQPSSRDADEKGLQEQQQGQQQRGSEWPLSVGTTGQKKGGGDGNTGGGNASPATGVTEAGHHAGYSTVPRVKQSASPVGQQQQRGTTAPGLSRSTMDPFEKERVQRMEAGNNTATGTGAGAGTGGNRNAQGENQEKGCGCCVVM